MIVGLLQLELHLPQAQSLKDKRSVLKSVKDQLRGRFNVAVAEIDPNETWQRATIGVVTIAAERGFVEALLRDVTEWVRATRLVALSRAEQELW